MSERDIHVVFETGKWKVLSAIAEEDSEFDNKEEAKRHAEQRAKLTDSSIIIHDTEGKISDEGSTPL